jgi:hypothetical protein
MNEPVNQCALGISELQFDDLLVFHGVKLRVVAIEELIRSQAEKTLRQITHCARHYKSKAVDQLLPGRTWRCIRNLAQRRLLFQLAMGMAERESLSSPGGDDPSSDRLLEFNGHTLRLVAVTETILSQDKNTAVQISMCARFYKEAALAELFPSRNWITHLAIEDRCAVYGRAIQLVKQDAQRGEGPYDTSEGRTLPIPLAPTAVASLLKHAGCRDEFAAEIDRRIDPGIRSLAG